MEFRGTIFFLIFQKLVDGAINREGALNRHNIVQFGFQKLTVAIWEIK